MLKLARQKDIGSLWFELISLVTGTRCEYGGEHSVPQNVAHCLTAELLAS